MSYSTFMSGLSKAKVALNRKQLAELAVNDGEAFGELVGVAREALAQD